MNDYLSCKGNVFCNLGVLWYKMYYLCNTMHEKKMTYEEPRADAIELNFNLSVLSASPTGESYDGQVQYDDGFDE